MTKHVTLKSFPGGIRVKLSEEPDFEQILKETEESFQDAASFFKNSSVALQFQGRALTEDETDRLLKVIQSVCDLHIICLSCTDESAQEYFSKLIDRTHADALAKEQYAQFYKGTLHDGETLESASGVIIMGDVHKGAAVIAKGSIIIVGALEGTAYAGANGNDNCFIVAMQLDAENLRIADVKHKKSFKQKIGLNGKKGSKLVNVSDNALIISELDFTKELPEFISIS